MFLSFVNLGLSFPMFGGNHRNYFTSLLVCSSTEAFKSTRRRASPIATGWRSRKGRREAMGWGAHWGTQTRAFSGCMLTWRVRRKAPIRFHVWKLQRCWLFRKELLLNKLTGLWQACYISSPLFPFSSGQAAGRSCRWYVVRRSDRGAQRLPCPLQSAESPWWQVRKSQPKLFDPPGTQHILLILNSLSFFFFEIVA